MTIDYTVTLRELVRSYIELWRYSATIRGLVLSTLSMFIVPIVIFVFLAVRGQQFVELLLLVGIVIFVGVALPIIVLVNPGALRRRVSIDPTGLHITLGRRSRFVPWAQVQTALAYFDYTVITYRDGHVIIPHRVFPTHQQFREFLHLLTQLHIQHLRG